ncbi:hypothetical protein JCGZ_10304 [Jatropha curcas]|uniref:Aminotransferase-like plant mobile domain-containing protein n=1 Tax=Jatropha curcas TaxID=180498 RepID=A0A067KIU6_JATCU|nr:hypothetical protein JCGZ_10304 [Jatropha curcas]
MAFRNQVSSFVQSIPDDLWQVPPMNQLIWLKYFKDLKPDHGFLSWLVTHFNPNTMVFRFGDSEVTLTYKEICAVIGHHPEQDETPALPPGPRYDLAEIVALCPVYLPDGINVDQGLPLEPFLSRVVFMNLDPSWIRACCFLLLNVYAMKNRQPGIGDFRLLTVAYCPSHHQLQCSSSQLSTAIASLGSGQVKPDSSGSSSLNANLWTGQLPISVSKTLRFWG